MSARELAPDSLALAFVDGVDGITHAIARSGEVVHANDRALLGHPAGQVIGRPFLDLVAEGHRPRVARALEALFGGFDTGALHTQLRTVGGVHVDVEGVLARLRGIDNVALAVFVPRRIDLRTNPAPFTVPDREITLTQRQKAVLQLFASGHTTKQVAATLDIAVKTVHNHLTTIYRVLNAQSLVQATMIAAQLGIVELAAPLSSSGLAGRSDYR